jgi:hypothetical protein
VSGDLSSKQGILKAVESSQARNVSVHAVSAVDVAVHEGTAATTATTHFDHGVAARALRGG